MGTVYNRGTRAKPNWWISYKDSNGERRYKATHQPTKALARRFLVQVESRIADGLVGIMEPEPSPGCGDLMTQWLESLRNRSASDDRSRGKRHVLPHFGALQIADIKLPVVMAWIDQQRAAGDLSDASIRHNLNLLSRFFSWAIERGLAEYNPVRQIPIGKRPKQSRKTDVPWLQDDAIVVRLIDVLPEPMNYMFYLGNRSGMRTGEIAGLRMSDLSFLDEDVIRVRYSYDGPLKEDTDDGGKVKWAPAAEDCVEFLEPWLERRRRAGVGPEDYVFPSPTSDRRPCNKKYFERKWRDAREKLGLELTWYQATRHSFSSRLLAAGATLDEVSAALGHSSPVVTRRYYDHFIRRSFSKVMRAGLDRGQRDDSPDEP